MFNYPHPRVGKSYSVKAVWDRIINGAMNYEALENKRKLEAANATALRNIAKDAEALRVSGMNHDSIRTTLEEKYVWWDRSKSSDISGLIDLCMWKKK